MNFDQHKKEPTIVEEICHLPDDQQAEAIAEHLSSISNKYNPLNTEDIQFAPFSIKNQFPNSQHNKFTNT